MEEKARLAYLGTYVSIWRRFVEGLRALYLKDTDQIGKFQEVCENLKEIIEDLERNRIPKKIEYAIVISSVWEDPNQRKKLYTDLAELTNVFERIKKNERFEENRDAASKIIERLISQLSSSTKNYQKELYGVLQIEPTFVRT